MLLFCVHRSAATHIYGGDLRYQYISGNEYKVILTLYADCAAASSNVLGGYTPRIRLKIGNEIVETHLLREDPSLRENVSPVCAAFKDSTNCDNPFSELPGARRFVYTTNVTMARQPNWKIVFEGLINPNGGAGSEAGRSENITNIERAGGQLVYLVATLNNMENHNSSPEFTAPATPYFCNNVLQNYNLGAVDNNNDTLVSYIIPALINEEFSVTYLAGYSKDIPIASVPGSFKYDTASGQLSFIPNLIQRSLLALRVEEYKNGVMVGSSMREMTFVVLPTCNNIPPTGGIDTNSIIGGVLSNGNSTINVCVAEPLLKLEIPATDMDGNEIDIKVNNVPPGAEVKIIDNGTSKPVLSLVWNTSEVREGVYNLYVSLTDNACPIAITQTLTYPIYVVKPTSISHEIMRATGCIGAQITKLTLVDGLVPRLVTVFNMEGIILRTYYDTTGIIVDSFRVGKYNIKAESVSLNCKSDYQFSVVDSGHFPISVIFSDRNVCINDEVIPINVSPVQGATLHWYDLQGNALHAWPEYTTDSVKTFNWVVTQQYDSCETKPDTLTVTVHDLPKVEILNTNEPLCTGDSVLLLAKGAVRYNWQPDNWMSQNDTLAWVRVRQPTSFVVTGFTEYNCTNTDTIMMDRLEQCCTFFYPDAFTPNNDGLNDRWAPVTEANADLYLLAIYNRWGERVYYSNNEHDKWDGTHNGRLCDMGTYTYMFRVKCVMGRQETTQGVLLLVR